jgi:hypothetical protein
MLTHANHTQTSAQDGGPAAYLCNYLHNHGVKPEKVLKRDGLAGADWDDPASVNALYVASTNSGPAQFAVTVMPMPNPTLMTMPQALPLHLMIVTEFLLPLWGAYRVYFSLYMLPPVSYVARHSQPLFATRTSVLKSASL